MYSVLKDTLLNIYDPSLSDTRCILVCDNSNTNCDSVDKSGPNIRRNNNAYNRSFHENIVLLCVSIYSSSNTSKKKRNSYYLSLSIYIYCRKFEDEKSEHIAYLGKFELKNIQ